MLPVVECGGVSKSFVLRTNRQSLLKDRVLAVLRPHLRETRESLLGAPKSGFTVDIGGDLWADRAERRREDHSTSNRVRHLQTDPGTVGCAGGWRPSWRLGSAFTPS